MPYSYWDIGACNCPGCSVTFKVIGCSSLPYAGLTVTVAAGGGVSGTTDGSGNVTLALPSAGTYAVSVTGQSSRFAAFSQNLALRCGVTYTLTLIPAAGFTCFVGCLIPVSTTLNITDGTHPRTMVWLGSYWTETTWYAVQLTPSGGLTGAAGGCISPSGGTNIVVVTTCPPGFVVTCAVPACPYGSLTITE